MRQQATHLGLAEYSSDCMELIRDDCGCRIIRTFHCSGCNDCMGEFQAGKMAVPGPFLNFLVLPGYLGTVSLHPWKLQDYWVLGGGHKQERDRFLMESTDLEVNGLSA